MQSGHSLSSKCPFLTRPLLLPLRSCPSTRRSRRGPSPRRPSRRRWTRTTRAASAARSCWAPSRACGPLTSRTGRTRSSSSPPRQTRRTSAPRQTTRRATSGCACCRCVGRWGGVGCRPDCGCKNCCHYPAPSAAQHPRAAAVGAAEDPLEAGHGGCDARQRRAGSRARRPHQPAVRPPRLRLGARGDGFCVRRGCCAGCSACQSCWPGSVSSVHPVRHPAEGSRQASMVRQGCTGADGPRWRLRNRRTGTVSILFLYL